MKTFDFQQLSDDTKVIVTAARDEDISIVDSGNIVAFITRPRRSADFTKYWQERERQLATIPALKDWDSATAVSEDRDRT